MIDITLVTCRAHPRLPEDDQFLQASLERRGIRHRVAIWDDPDVDWSESSVTLLRAAWDSHLNPPSFIAWLNRLGSQSHLLNTPSLVQWNFDKQYLVELREKGTNVVPTAILTSASEMAISQALQQIPAAEIVVKPRFGGDAYGVTRLPPEPEAIAAHFKRFGANGGLLIQPFIPGVELERERSLVFIGGRFSHALYRNPFGSGPTRQTPDNVHTPTAEELRYCSELLGSLPRLTYARVDLLPFYGRPALMELEIIDPSLFFKAQPSAADLLAAEVQAAIERAERASVKTRIEQ
jgi:glutathione synthase/RimK-type ligase-like ATP-grasp enzyme